jgi:kinetochore protein Spc24
MKKVEAAKWEAQRPADRSEAAHAERMAQLDRDRYTLAKGVNDLELAIQREDATLKQLTERLLTTTRRLNELEAGHTAFDENKIRSLVFKDMGVSWALEELDGVDQIGGWREAIIKSRILSRRSNDVFTLTFNPNSNSFEDAHQMWNCLGK